MFLVNVTFINGHKRVMDLHRGIINSHDRFMCLSTKFRHKESDTCEWCIAEMNEIEMPSVNNKEE